MGHGGHRQDNSCWTAPQEPAAWLPRSSLLSGQRPRRGGTCRRPSLAAAGAASSSGRAVIFPRERGQRCASLHGFVPCADDLIKQVPAARSMPGCGTLSPLMPVARHAACVNDGCALNAGREALAKHLGGNSGARCWWLLTMQTMRPSSTTCCRNASCIPRASSLLPRARSTCWTRAARMSARWSRCPRGAACSSSGRGCLQRGPLPGTRRSWSRSWLRAAAGCRLHSRSVLHAGSVIE